MIFSFLVSFFGVWGARVLAMRWQLMDHPNERSFHDGPIPRIGGLGLILGSGGVFLFVDASGLNGLWACALAVGMVSLMDDWIELPRLLRFGVHAMAAVALLWLYPSWQANGFPLLGEMSFLASALLLFIWVTGLVNAYNFMDGIDGIAAWQGISASVGWTLVFWMSGNPVEATAFLGLGLACLGFLCWNRPTAKIFLGDVGSTFLGLIFAGAPLVAMTLGVPGTTAYAAGFLFVWPFVADTGQTLLWRALKREPVFEAHRSHIYQRLAATWPDRRSGHWASGLLYG
ncbi:MAG TPA: glycosyltransferase family 4 protein, partial [Oceanipulchritudo sp.]|nr:glycosyltransferase family 4 protein [Oceanipulchritudo sp.]